MLIVQLLQNVLDLSLKLIVNLVHQVLEHFRHAELLGLLSELLTSEDRVQSSVHICPNLGILVFDKLIEDFQ